MASRIFSRPFYVKQGLSGTGPSIIVPAGHVYVVKQVTMYASPLAVTTVFFEHEPSGAALFSTRFNIDAGGSTFFYGAIAFEAGEGFHFQVNSDPLGEAADVYAGGYDLVND